MNADVPQIPTEPSWRALLKNGQIDQALLSYQLNEVPDADELQSLKVLSAIRNALREKNWPKALKLLDTNEDAPNLVNWADLKAQLVTLQSSAELIDQHDSAEALAQLEQLDSKLLEPELETLRGTAFIFENDITSAKAAFQHAVTLDPKHYRALTNLGNLALEAGETNRAIEFYEKALKIEEDFPNALHNLGVAYRKKGHMNQSIKYLKKAQTASQKTLREEARASLTNSSPQLKRFFKWAIYGVIAIVVFFILRSQGLI